MSDASDGRAGQRFGPYELLSLLGRGGMGEVYEARDTVKDRVVALKLLPEALADDAEYQERFRREARTAARLQEPHVIPIHDFGEIDGVLYIDMRLVRGRDLRSILKSDGALGTARSLAVVAQVAAALDAAHADGLVHRDIKPENVLVTQDDFAYLADFGIASSEHDSRLTGTGSAIGSIAYMAPERFRDEQVTPAADVYSLSCLLHECLTGQTPYRPRTVSAQIAAHLYDPPPLVSQQRADVPASLDSVVARGLAKEPRDRYRTAGELANAARQAMPENDQDHATTILRAAGAGGVAAGAGSAGDWSASMPFDSSLAPTTSTPVGGYAAGPTGQGSTGYGQTGGAGWTSGHAGGGNSPTGAPPQQSSQGVQRAWWIAAAVAAIAALVAGVAVGINVLGDEDSGQGAQSPAPLTSQGSTPTASAPSSSASTGSASSAPQSSGTTESPTPSTTAAPSTATVTVTPTQPAQPTQPTTQAPAGLSGPGYDRQGWTHSTLARCNANDSAQTVARYTNSWLSICARADNGSTYYRGYRTTTGKGTEIDFPTRSGSGWQARKEGHTYFITPSSLRITNPAGKQILDEPNLAYASD